ncbi:potassium channel family protein [Mycoplasma seminis]|uniref:Potassium channel family protein n=1 Tax=Mycoplasma seminis TaxID=512749 RepID=A0ABY9HA83_9MOLU|nr:potassium channel family protein [Mycoplasma seminis]WLP85505.1 potassium channel family protein [Mycoplasma seminis]
MKVKFMSKATESKWLKIISLIAWSNPLIPEGLSKEKHKIKLFTYIYAILISFSCFVSFLTLIEIPEESTHSWNKFLVVVQIMTFFVFIIDYFTHMFTYKIHYPELKLPMWRACIKFVFSFTGIVILLCMLASFNAIAYLMPESQANQFDQSAAAKFFDAIKSLTIFKIVRFFLILTLFAPFQIISEVFVQQRRVLTYVFILIIILIVLFALIIWNSESVFLRQNQIQFIQEQIQTNGEQYHTLLSTENGFTKQLLVWGYDPKGTVEHNASVIYNYLTNQNFSLNIATNKLGPNLASDVVSFVSAFNALGNGYPVSVWHAIYFTTITLTTIGYGDYVPHSPMSKGIVTFISLVSIAIIAIPSGLIAGSFLNEMQKHFKNNSHNKIKETADEIKSELKDVIINPSRLEKNKSNSKTDNNKPQKKE